MSVQMTSDPSSFSMLVIQARDRSCVHLSPVSLFPELTAAKAGGKKQNNNKAGEKSQSLLREGKAWHRDYHPSQDSKKAMASWVPAMG